MKKLALILFLAITSKANAQLKMTAPLFEEEIYVAIYPLHEQLYFWSQGWDLQDQTGDKFDMFFLQTDVNLSKHYSNEDFRDLFFSASSYVSGIKRIKGSVKNALDAPKKSGIDAMFDNEYKNGVKTAALKEAEKYATYEEALNKFREKYAEDYKNAAYDETAYFVYLSPEKIEPLKIRVSDLDPGITRLRRPFYKTDKTLYFETSEGKYIRATMEEMENTNVSEKSFSKVILQIEKALTDLGFAKKVEKGSWEFTKGASSPADVFCNKVIITANDFSTDTQGLVTFYY